MKLNMQTQLKILTTISMVTLLLSGPIATAQGKPLPAKNKSPFPVKYTSEIDQKLNLRTITLAPVYDNVNKVYSEPIQKLLIELLQNDKVWGYSPFPEVKEKLFVETYDTNSAAVLDVLNKTASQGLLTAIITKGPNGLSAKLRLYTSDQGLILAEESFQDLTTFEVPRLRNEFVTLYQNIKNKLPYRALILSRRGIDVTLNAGSKNSLSVGQELSLAQIVKMNRHPKLKYLVGTEKEVIGRVQITKVEPYLSFAQIIFEKETGVVDVGAKVLPTDSISYPRPVINSEGEVIGDKVTKPQSSSSDQNAASIDKKNIAVKAFQAGGKALIQGGLGQYNESGRFNSGATVETSQPAALGFLLGADYWFTQNWFVHFNLFQSSFKSTNSLLNSTPTTLNYTYAKYSAAGGYNFLLLEDFWGPKFSVELGYSTYKSDVTDTSPTAFTSTSTSGLDVKISGSFPLQPEYPIDIGASFDILLAPTFSESPTTSGTSSARINSFGLNMIYHASQNLNYRFDLNFDQIQADFDSTALKRSSTLSLATQLFGIEYIF